jgi:hypothetical protein
VKKNRITRKVGASRQYPKGVRANVLRQLSLRPYSQENLRRFQNWPTQLLIDELHDPDLLPANYCGDGAAVFQFDHGVNSMQEVQVTDEGWTYDDEAGVPGYILDLTIARAKDARATILA